MNSNADQNRRMLDYTSTALKNTNFMMIAFISGIFMATTWRICNAMEAGSFLKQLSAFPMVPWKVPLFSLGSFAGLMLIFEIRRHKKENVSVQIISVILEIILCVIIMSTLHWNYSGVILLVVTDILDYNKKTKAKAAFLFAAFVLYALTDYDLIATRWNINSFQTYLTYYNTSTQTILTGMKTILESLNILLFILYMILLIRNQMQENQRVQLLNEQLVNANAQLEIYAGEIEKMAETRERNRLAREIHDTLGHALTGIIAGIDACTTTIDKSPELTKKQLSSIGEVARQGIKDVRRSVSALRPDVLERLKLSEALEKMVSEMEETAKTTILFQNQIGNLRLGEDEEEVIYRIIQEGITNSIRHGKAQKIEINLWREYNKITILINDNGIGCKELKRGFGIRHMEERLQMLNGTIEYNGADGFILRAEIPIRWGEEIDED